MYHKTPEKESHALRGPTSAGNTPDLGVAAAGGATESLSARLAQRGQPRPRPQPQHGVSYPEGWRMNTPEKTSHGLRGPSSAGGTPGLGAATASQNAGRQLARIASSPNDDGAALERRVRPRLISHRQGWCRERSKHGDCGCFKAGLSQKCQACGDSISEGHCIQNIGYGWNHVLCRGDEMRESGETLTSGFVPQADRLALEDDGRTRRKLTYGEESGGKDEESDNSDTEPGGNKDADEVKSDGTDNVSDNGNSSGPTHGLTSEQKRIVDHCPSPGDVIRIRALAGCGKTTTCAFVSHEHNKRLGDHCKQLYVVFNNAAQEEARASHKFPKNVQILTSHALAKRKLFGTGNMFPIANNLNRSAVIDYLDLTEWVRGKFQGMDEDQVPKVTNTIARFVILTVDKFQHSADTTVSSNHVCWKALVKPQTNRSEWKKKVSEARYAAWSQRIFDLMMSDCEFRAPGKHTQDPCSRVGITHDSYLKCLQLRQSEYDFSYDVVLVDECQDMTPCQADLLWGASMIQDSIVYLVGDENQRLYAFRGATDSFEKAEVVESFPLSGSFRFGRNIGKAANLVLGCSTEARVQGLAAEPGHIYDDTFRRGVVICRTRNGMYRYLETHCTEKWTFLSPRQKLPSTSSTLEPLESFYLKRKETHRYHKETFNSWVDLEEYAEDEADTDLLSHMSLVKDFHDRNENGASICTTYDSMSQNWVNWRDEQERHELYDINLFGGIALVTCHGAKGLEFENVLLYDDFGFEALIISEGLISVEYQREMLNLIYVAITRAKVALHLSKPAEAFLNWAKAQCGMDCDSDSDGNEANGDTLSKSDLKAIRKRLEVNWNIFLTEEKKNEPIKMTDIPWPTGPKGNEFALCSSMTIVEQRSYIKTYMLRYHTDKFLPSFNKLLKQLSNNDRITVRERVRKYSSICNLLWQQLRECSNIN